MGTWTTSRRPWTCCCSTRTSDGPSGRPPGSCHPVSGAQTTTALPSVPHRQARGCRPELWLPCPRPELASPFLSPSAGPSPPPLPQPRAPVSQEEFAPSPMPAPRPAPP